MKQYSENGYQFTLDGTEISNALAFEIAKVGFSEMMQDIWIAPLLKEGKDNLDDLFITVLENHIKLVGLSLIH